MKENPTVADILEIMTIRDFNKNFQKRMSQVPEVDEDSRKIKLKNNGFVLSKDGEFYVKDTHKIHSSYINDHSEKWFDSVIDSDLYNKKKYKKIYSVLKNIANPHERDLTVKFSHLFEDETVIKIDSPSFHIHLSMTNPTFGCLVDTKREVLKEFRDRFKEYLKP